LNDRNYVYKSETTVLFGQQNKKRNEATKQNDIRQR